MALSELSMPMARRPELSAACMVLPEPQNASNTMLLGSEDALTIVSSIARFFSVG